MVRLRAACHALPRVARWAGAVGRVASSNDRALFGRGLSLTRPVILCALRASLREHVRDFIPSGAYVRALVYDSHVPRWACFPEAAVGEPQRAVVAFVSRPLRPL